MTTWLITGCSTGLGRGLAEEVLSQGHSVVLTARDVGSLRDLAERHPSTAMATVLDVRDRLTIDGAVKSGTERFGGIDVLVNNAGYGYRAAVEEGGDDDIQDLFATHVFGAVDTIKAVLPQMRERRSGTVVNFSSIGVRHTNAGSGYYVAAKAAVEGITGSLRKEVAPLGITAFCVEPGAFRTDFAGRSLKQSDRSIDDYEDTAGRRRKERDATHGTQPGDPRKAARALMEVVASGDAPELFLMGTCPAMRSPALTPGSTCGRHRWTSGARWVPLRTSKGSRERCCPGRQLVQRRIPAERTAGPPHRPWNARIPPRTSSDQEAKYRAALARDHRDWTAPAPLNGLATERGTRPRSAAGGDGGPRGNQPGLPQPWSIGWRGPQRRAGQVVGLGASQ